MSAQTSLILHLTLQIQEYSSNKDIIATSPTMHIHPPFALIHDYEGNFQTNITSQKFNMAMGKILSILLRTYLCNDCVLFWILVAMSKDCILNDGGFTIFCWNCTMLAYSMRLECMHFTTNLNFFWVFTCALCLKVGNNEVLIDESLPLDYPWH